MLPFTYAKYAVCEFSDIEIPDIIRCIGDTIEIGSRPADPGLSDTGRVSGTATEDNIPEEGLIFFDIRFSAYLLRKEIKFLINVETQKSYDPAKPAFSQICIWKRILPIRNGPDESRYYHYSQRREHKERLTAIRRMIHAGASRKQILSYGYTPDEYAQVQTDAEPYPY